MLNAESITDTAIKYLSEYEGFNNNNPYPYQRYFILAIARAVVDHIHSDAKADIQYGDSAGKHPIE